MRNVFLALFCVVFAEYFQLIPTLPLYIGLTVFCLLGIWKDNFYNFFLYLGVSIAILTLLPPPIMYLIKKNFGNEYVYSFETLILVIVISFLCGGYLKKKHTMRLFPLLASSIILVLTFVLFQKVFVYEYYLFLFVLFLVAINFVYLGSTLKSNLHHKRPVKVLSFVVLVLVFIFSNTIYHEKVNSVAFVNCFGKWADIKTRYLIKPITLKSGYSYSLMLEALSNKYDVSTINDISNLEHELNKADVAIMITPTTPIDRRSKKILLDFVSKGHRLVMISDHTDLFGHGRVINALLKEVGVEIEYNSLFKANDHYGTVNLLNTPLRSIRPKTPNSISFKAPAFAFGWANGWISEQADYSKPHFFGDFRWTADDAFGKWIVGGVVKYGKGDVLVWGDSTIFANFSIFQPNHLTLLGLMIEGGRNMATSAKYGLFICVIFLIGLLFHKFYNSIIATLFSLSLIISSGSYFYWDFDIEDFYKDQKRIDIYSEKELLDEPPNNRMPKTGRISSLYSHIARCGIWPLFKDGEPQKPVTRKSVWVTQANKIDEIEKEIANSLSGIIITDMEEINKNFGFKKIILKDDLAEEFAPTFNPSKKRRKVWLTRDGYHTYPLHMTSLFAAQGVVTDQYFGDWWITTEINPYRKQMLEQFCGWIRQGDNIKSFDYPSPGIVVGGEEWLIKSVNSNGFKSKFDIVPYSKDSKYVYLGSGIWALFGKDKEAEYLLGGQELSDNLNVSGTSKWAAKKIKQG
tara:strand:+ start:844 stop:3078 length:2235 start_codon:yes stop_codon:yes gene_type:complete